ncbi:MAG: CmcJ/NvfI family oxidoreductase [Pseudomonadota bacterium]
MPTALELALLDAIPTSLHFGVATETTPVTIVNAAEVGDDERLGTFEEHPVAVHDARPLVDRLGLDSHGFSLARHETAVRDFYDPEEVMAVYYPEMEALVGQATGAAKVIVFDHTIRIDDGGLQKDRQVRAPVRNVHNDFTVASAEQRVRDLLPPAEAAARLSRRFGSINVWRPITGPVETAPLAICEYGSIRDENLIAAERRYQDRIGGIYYLSYDPDQRWYYFPRMTRDEVVLLKCYDSRTDGTARWTAHGAFVDPESPADAPPRESIEIRTLMFFDGQ